MASWDKDWLEVIADVFTDLSAAWFALVIVTPAAFDVPVAEIIRAIVMNISYGLFSLWIAVKLRKLV